MTNDDELTFETALRPGCERINLKDGEWLRICHSEEYIEIFIYTHSNRLKSLFSMPRENIEELINVIRTVNNWKA